MNETSVFVFRKKKEGVNNISFKIFKKKLFAKYGLK